MPQRDQEFPGRSRPPRTLLDDVRADEASERAPDGIGASGQDPPSMQARVVDDDPRDVARLYSCPTCPATHTAEMMVRADELAGPMIDDLPLGVDYICAWCDQHGRRTGRIRRDVP